MMTPYIQLPVSLVDWNRRWAETTEEEMAERHTWCRLFGKDPEVYPILREVRQLIRNMVEIADLYKDDLSLTSMVASAHSMEYLLFLFTLKEGDENSKLAKQRRFDALKMFDLTRLAYEEDRDCPQQKYDQYLGEIVQIIQTQVFDGSRHVQACVYHDPEDGYKVKGVGLDKRIFEMQDLGFFERHAPLTCRVFVHEGREHVALFDDRNKPVVDAVLKRIKQEVSGRDGLIRDRSGIMMAVESLAALDVLLKRLHEVFGKSKSKLNYASGNLRAYGAVKDPGNLHSSAIYQVEEYEIVHTFDDREQVCELQFLLFDGYYNGRWSLTRANHRFYRLLQCLDFYFPLLFPRGIYGVDWTSEEVRERLKSHVVAQIGLRLMNGNRAMW